jgi:tetratricopeptide (TPR) repeat protein
LARQLRRIPTAPWLTGAFREAAYIATTLAYYDGAADRPEQESLKIFREGWKSVYEAWPDDIEAAAFYALAHMATASPSDKTMAKQTEAGSIAQQVLAQIPDHPAGHHYTIHAYDSPRFADQALAVARNYSEVAPEVPHALHMPTHIFTRLGLWDESIDMNTRSAVAAEKSTGGEYVSSQMLHAEDYLVYAHLQKGREQEARTIMDKAMQLEAPFDKNAIGAAAYALAAMPARIALESRNWEEGAKLAAKIPASFPWGDAFAEFEAISWFGRGVGAARSGQGEVASQAIEALDQLKAVLDAEGDGYWATQVEVQAQTVRAWLAYSQGDEEGGLAMMQQAAALENSTDKHPITPGELLPANELYGDMLLESGQAESALAAYRSSLERSPNRFNSLFGAAAAAEELEDLDTAVAYLNQLLEMTQDSEADWDRLATARRFMADVETEAAGP